MPLDGRLLSTPFHCATRSTNSDSRSDAMPQRHKACQHEPLGPRRPDEPPKPGVPQAKRRQNRPRLAEIAQIWPNSCRPHSPNIGQNRTKFARNHPSLAYPGPTLSRVGPNLPQVVSNACKCGRGRGEFDRFGAVEFGPSLAEFGPKLAGTRSEFGRVDEVHGVFAREMKTKLKTTFDVSAPSVGAGPSPKFRSTRRALSRPNLPLAERSPQVPTLSPAIPAISAGVPDLPNYCPTSVKKPLQEPGPTSTPKLADAGPMSANICGPTWPKLAKAGRIRPHIHNIDPNWPNLLQVWTNSTPLWAKAGQALAQIEPS